LAFFHELQQATAMSSLLKNMIDPMNHGTGSLITRCFLSAIALVLLVPSVASAQTDSSNPNVELLRRAKAGDSDAQQQIARKYWLGDGTKQNMEKARFWYGKAAEGGNAFACVEYGKMLAIGTGGPLDQPAATVWFRKAAEAGDASGMFWLAHSLQIGSGTAIDTTEAASWYHRAAELGDISATYNLAQMYLTGSGVRLNEQTAISWFRRAAELGETRAMHELGNRYARGNGVSRNIPEAVRWLKSAAESGNANAQHDLGAMHYYGHGIARNRGEAAKWLNRAAAQNFVPSQAMLGGFYLTAEPPDYDKALTLLGKASDAGNADAMCTLASMYERGIGVGVNEKSAFELYHRAAQTGHLNACYAMGGMISDGRGGYARDDKTALQWLELAANRTVDPLDENQRVTIAAAQLLMGTIYDNVSGYNNVQKQPDLAIDCYRRAAENGSLVAQRLYGQRLRDRGQYQEAMAWLRKAAEKGDRPAQNDLGTMYYNGQSVAASRTDAIAWWLKAYRQGSTTARDSLRKIGVDAP
jgi:TPR repeat protein